MERQSQSSYQDLLIEQAAIQTSKFQGRTLNAYSHFLFPGHDWEPNRHSEVADMFESLCPNDAVSLGNVLAGMNQVRRSQPITWADMGSGRGLAMRQLAAMNQYAATPYMIAVDLFDYGLEGLADTELATLEKLQPGMTSEGVTPQILLGDITSVSLPTKPDFISCVETIQYLDNPIEALCHWYNSLADDGYLVVASERDWSSWIGYTYLEDQPLYRSPFEVIIPALERSGIAVAITDMLDTSMGFRTPRDLGVFRALAIQKQPGTRLYVQSQVTKVETDRTGFKAVCYDYPAEPAESVTIFRDSAGSLAVANSVEA